MTSSYEAQDFTPVLAKELAAVLARCDANSNLKLAVDDVLAASQSKAATATDAEITSDVAQMDVKRARAELIVMIGSYRRLLRASAALLLGNAEGHIHARKDTGRKGAAQKLANSRIHAAKPEVLKLWEDWQAMNAVYKSGADFDRKAVDAFPVITDIKTVFNWRRKWKGEASK